MDNICHTLAGLAIGETGLKRRCTSRLAAATLMIGANLPDVDVLAYAISPLAALGFRRGWTHGILAMALWPLVLAGVMWGLEELTRGKGKGEGGKNGDSLPLSPSPFPRFRGLLLLSALSIWSHPLLDLLNTYGVRLLMPFSGRWFYGDTLFIVDPWVWLTLLAGVVLSWLAQRRGSPRPFRPGRIAGGAVLGYLVVMAMLGVMSRGAVRRSLAGEGLEVERLMVAPAPVHPLRKYAVAVVPGGYTTADVSWFLAQSPDGTPIRRAGPIVQWGGALEERGDSLPAARRAAATEVGRIFLSWARFPVFESGAEADCDAGMVCIRDLRYYRQGWAEVAVPVGAPLSSPATP